MDALQVTVWVIVAVALTAAAAMIIRDQRRARAAETARTAEWTGEWQTVHGSPPPPDARPPSRLDDVVLPPVQRTDPVAALALVFGLLGGLLAVPLGHLALHRIQRSGDGGRGLALTGLVIGYVSLILYSFAAYVLFNLGPADELDSLHAPPGQVAHPDQR